MLSTFIKLPFVIKIFVVAVYTGFIVLYFSSPLSAAMVVELRDYVSGE